jgi:hypothetical protein
LGSRVNVAALPFQLQSTGVSVLSCATQPGGLFGPSHSV